MKKILLLSMLSFSLNLYSAELECNIKLNQNLLSETKVSTSLNKKITIESAESIIVYVTEKAGEQFQVEAYLKGLDLRLYGEGALHQVHDKLVVSTWGRESLVDIECLRL